MEWSPGHWLEGGRNFNIYQQVLERAAFLTGKFRSAKSPNGNVS